MGYTHYWTQKKSFTPSQWTKVSQEIDVLLRYIQINRDIRIVNSMGDPDTNPQIDAEGISFNGPHSLGLESADFSRDIMDCNCKTNRRPYDLAVTACLCYFATVTQSHEVSSDGAGEDFLAGLKVAKAALPHHRKILDLPMSIMRRDRWQGPYVTPYSNGYQVQFCVDGHGYVVKTKNEETVRFETHQDLALFLHATKVQGNLPGARRDHAETNIWNAFGSFNAARTARLEKYQTTVLKRLFPSTQDAAMAPPAFVRPGDFEPKFEVYYFEDLIKTNAE